MATGAAQYRFARLESGVAVHTWTSGGGPSSVKPVLVALHGWADDGEVFAPLARRVSGRCDVIAPDAPGHGRTPALSGRRFRFEDLVAPAVAALEFAAASGNGGRPVVLLGHSMGAATALRAAAQRPDLIAHLICEEPPVAPPFGPWSRWKDIHWRRRLQGMSLDERAVEMALTAPEWSTEERLCWARSMARADLTVLATLRSHAGLTPPKGLRVPTPSTVVLGGAASTGMNRQVQRYVDACDDVRLVRVGVGHNPRREDPDGFVQTLAAVLDGLSATTGRCDEATLT